MPQSSRKFRCKNEAIEALAEPAAVWLPNALVDGAADEVPPLELVRQTRNLHALRLLIELYAAQFLPHFGGVPREVLQNTFEHAKKRPAGTVRFVGLQEKNVTASWDLVRWFLTGQKTARADGTYVDSGWDALFWPAVDTIIDLGLVESVGMLLDGNDAEAEIIHFFGVEGGEPIECRLAATALAAAESMLRTDQINQAKDQGYYPRLVPVQRHISNVTLVEIFRLKYRPHTAATAAWYAMLQHTAKGYLDRYEAMIKKHQTT